MAEKMNLKERLALVKRNVVEVITEQELVKLLGRKKPVVYCGYEPSGAMHIGHFVTIMKLMDFAKAGFKVKVLLADIHALLNRKGDEKEIAKNVKAWKKTVKAVGLEADVVVGSSFQFGKDYQSDIMKMAQVTTMQRGLRSMQEVARDIQNATISQIWYPLMQIEDIKTLNADVATSGLDQRKIHMLGRELSDVTKHKFVAVHTPVITSLKGPGTKISKSIPGSGFSVVDADSEIRTHIRNAYCPPKVVVGNPILELAQMVIFPKLGKLHVERASEHGGDMHIEDYKTLESIYREGRLHPADLKAAVAEHMIRIITPIRKNFKY